MMVPARSPHSSAAMVMVRLRSSIDMDQNSPCLPATNRPRMARSSIQWRILARNPASSIASVSSNGVRAAAQMPRMCCSRVGLGLVLRVSHSALLRRAASHHRTRGRTRRCRTRRLSGTAIARECVGRDGSERLTTPRRGGARAGAPIRETTCRRCGASARLGNDAGRRVPTGGPTRRGCEPSFKKARTLPVPHVRACVPTS